MCFSFVFLSLCAFVSISNKKAEQIASFRFLILIIFAFTAS